MTQFLEGLTLPSLPLKDLYCSIYFLCDIRIEDQNNYFVNYANGITPYFVGSTTAEVLENLSCLTKKLFSWFVNNQMKVNDDKYHLISSSSEEDAATQIELSRIKYLKVKKLLGIHIDYKLDFDTYVDTSLLLLLSSSSLLLLLLSSLLLFLFIFHIFLSF